jgi:hypothetical protein
MTINRKYWKPPFSNFPSWVCPSCQSGTLVLDKDTLKSSETGPSKEAHGCQAWEPDWIEKRFSGQLVCQNAACGEIVAIGGRTHHVENHDWEMQEKHWDEMCEPKFIFPAPPIFTLPENCPPATAEELKKAFSLYWSDLESSAGRLRAATEGLLTERKVPRYTVNKKGKKVRLTLHERIEMFSQTDASSAKFLLAIKWQGNTGSHASDTPLAQDDLLNGFELFEHVVERIYMKKEKRLNKIAKEINSRKGRLIQKRKRLP